ncbi:MAG: hypothetical protein WAZ18_01185 [Alphaproteobacteria bacterium]
MKPLILCMKWGTRYGAEYVNRLHSMCVRGMGGKPFDFVCFTDDATGLVAGVDARPLPSFEGVPAHLAVKPWRKLTLWKDDLDKDFMGRNTLVLDVDVVITGDLQAFFEFEPAWEFVVWRNPTKPNSGVGNTSVFRFKVGSHPEICERFVANPVGVWQGEFRIEQELIAARLGDGTAARETGLRPEVANDPFYKGLNVMGYWPAGWCVSFKEDVMPEWPMRLWQEAKLPVGARVVVFHGKPDPDEALRGEWPSVWWKRWYKTIRPVGWIADYWR